MYEAYLMHRNFINKLQMSLIPISHLLGTVLVKNFFQPLKDVFESKTNLLYFSTYRELSYLVPKEIE